MAGRTWLNHAVRLQFPTPGRGVERTACASPGRLRRPSRSTTHTAVRQTRPASRSALTASAAAPPEVTTSSTRQTHFPAHRRLRSGSRCRSPCLRRGRSGTAGRPRARRRRPARRPEVRPASSTASACARGRRRRSHGPGLEQVGAGLEAIFVQIELRPLARAEDEVALEVGVPADRGRELAAGHPDRAAPRASRASGSRRSASGVPSPTLSIEPSSKYRSTRSSGSPPCAGRAPARPTTRRERENGQQPTTHRRPPPSSSSAAAASASSSRRTGTRRTQRRLQVVEHECHGRLRPRRRRDVRVAVADDEDAAVGRRGLELSDRPAARLGGCGHQVLHGTDEAVRVRMWRPRSRLRVEKGCGLDPRRDLREIGQCLVRPASANLPSRQCEDGSGGWFRSTSPTAARTSPR